jgi:uncharacterized protein (DUF2141 family)
MGPLLRSLAALAAGLMLAAIAAPAIAETQDCHGEPSANRLYITVEGVRSERGFTVANVYGADRHRFLADNGWLYVWRDPAQRGEVTMCMYLPEPGSYAVVVFHDANGNGELDMGAFGPREGYGFSNNVRPILSAPSLNSVSFPVSEGVTRLRIRLRYP